MARWREIVSVLPSSYAPRLTPSVIFGAQGQTRLGGSHGQQYREDSASATSLPISSVASTGAKRGLRLDR